MFDNEIYYNQFDGLEDMPYKIIEHMMENNEKIFKLLKYMDKDALDKPNLSQSEKAALIYKGEVDSTNSRIFIQSSTDDAFTNEIAQFRVYPDYIYPENHIVGKVYFVFEILTHNKINTLRDGYKTRIICMLNEVLRTFNGVDVNGVGSLFFDASASRNVTTARQNIYNQKNYFGYSIVMGVNCGNVTDRT
jgi:hypothetical protein